MVKMKNIMFVILFLIAFINFTNVLSDNINSSDLMVDPNNNVNYNYNDTILIKQKFTRF